ncbi:TRAP transporter small permease [Aestuariispira insulae]|uniref:TRAP transporter small permease protein n=1 Tax=Aestuariispira insulae TaxID=1461337 RepID=A0A3D9H1M7_9PROT|nr:TRAP transporter small permease [Aestuariispira insulae]RED43398.1 TRAP-type C4-dicarboxylate transport system permease small subunit [Aestuariispira insulae]
METKLAENGTSLDEKQDPKRICSSLLGIQGKIDSLIGRFESFMLATGVLLMAGNTVANVIGRYIFQHSLFFTEEVNRILIILITFAGVGYAARQGRHIRMSAIYDALPVRMRKFLMITISVVTAGMMFLLCYFSLAYIGKVMASGRVLPALQIPVWWIFVWVPLGFFMTGLQYLLTAVKNILEKDVYLSTSVLEGYDDTEIEI